MNEERSGGSTAYVLGHTPSELQRLAMQGQFWGEATLEIMAKAGIGRGMRVLDLGSGAGDVALLAASLVGESGVVLGVDKAPASIDTATKRAQAAGLSNIRFQLGSIEELELEGTFDALLGRLVLMYLRDPAASLTTLVRRFLRPGGVLLFMEFDMDAIRSTPPAPVVDHTGEWLRKTFQRAGNPTALGPQLPQLFRAAGLPEPQIIARVRMEAAPALESTRYLAATVRSLLPMMEKSGVARAEDVGIDTLAERMQEALVAANSTMIVPTLVGAWARIA